MSLARAYIDTCSLQRPLNDQTQPRIRVETEAVLAILTAVQANNIELLGSEELEYEINRIPGEQRRYDALAILTVESRVVDALRFLSQFRAGTGDYTTERPETFQGMGVKEIISDIKRQRQRNRHDS